MSVSWTMFGTSHEVLSPAQLKRLGDHKYCCASCSLLDPIMQKYWNWLVGRLPMGLAPNLITVLGLLVNIITSVIVMLYSPDAKQEAPWWTFVLCAFGLFVYQSLDAIDGKQARRTGTSSALGELFDHGCDSISTVFGAVAMSAAVQLGELPSWMFFQCFAAMTLFYCAHWQTYVSGTLRFGKIDVTEAQFGVMAVHMTSAIMGPSIWATRLPVLQLQLKLLPIILCGAAGTVALVSYFRTIFTGGIGKNGSTVAGTSVLSPFIPWSLVVVPAFIIYRKSISGIYENHPCLYILAFGLVSAKVTNRLVVAHMTKSEMDYLDTVLFGPGLLFLNQYFNTAISEYIVLWLCLLWSAIDLLRYSTVVCNQICRYLHIHLFSISPRPPESPSATSATALHSGLPSSRNGTFSRTACRR